MSVIAGCSMFDGIILLSDCRATLSRTGSKDIYVDNVQKIFPILPTTAIGFAGNICSASKIIAELASYLKQKKGLHKLNSIKLLEWLPRYIRYKYGQISNTIPEPEVIFMVASIVSDRPNVIERAKVVEIMERFRLNKLSVNRNWIPSILVEILKTPPSKENVSLSNVPLGLLYVMKPPLFVPEFIKPLEYSAIGSGEKVVEDIDRFVDWIFAGDVGNPYMEASSLREVVSKFIENNKIQTVGGLYPCIKINGNGIQFLENIWEIPVGGTKIELSFSAQGRWVQKNLITGKTIEIKYPWEIDFSKYLTDKKFDDMKKAFKEMENGN